MRNLVSQGRFESEEAVVVEGIRLLMSGENLRREIQLAVDHMERGEWVEEEDLFNEVDAEIDRMESSQSGS